MVRGKEKSESGWRVGDSGQGETLGGQRVWSDEGKRRGVEGRVMGDKSGVSSRYTQGG